jgi:hypothetical protein
MSGLAPLSHASRNSAQRAAVFSGEGPRLLFGERNGTKTYAINRSLSVTPCSAQNRAISSSVRMWFRTRTVKIRCSGGFR